MARLRRRKTNSAGNPSKRSRNLKQNKILSSEPRPKRPIKEFSNNAGTEPNDVAGGISIETKSRRRKSKHESVASSRRKRGSLTELEGSDIDIRKRPPILRIPIKIRVVIWKLLPTSAILSLRRVCHRIKVDIDNFVGLPAVIDQTHRSFEFFSRVGIRQANIILLEEKRSTPFRLLLKDPYLLEELNIEGIISDGYFAYFMDSCVNLRHINILFTKELLLLQPKFFPISPINVQQLGHLRKVEITSETRFNHELQCVQDNIQGLFEVNLKNIPITWLNIQIIHEVYTDVLIHCHQVIAEFVNAKAKCLTTVRVTIKEKRPNSVVVSESEYDSVIGQLLSHPELMTKSSDLRSVFTSELYEMEFGELQIMPMRGFSPVRWRRFRKAKDFLLAVNGIHAHVWKLLPLKMKILEYLYLELITTGGNWGLYKTTVHNCSRTLKEVTLLEVTVVPFIQTTNKFVKVRRKLSTIDVGFIKQCTELQSLIIKCKQTESGTICKLESICSLPKALEDVQFSHVIISPFQLTRLLVFHRNLRKSKTEYCSSSSASLRRLLCYLRFSFKFKCTRIPTTKIVDHKLWFQEENASVQKFVKSLAPVAHYSDLEQTMIAVNLPHSVE